MLHYKIIQSALLEELGQRNCPYCQAQFILYQELVVCPDPSCQSPHHLDCWSANGNKCAMFKCIGCGEVTLEESQTDTLNEVVVTILDVNTQITSIQFADFSEESQIAINEEDFLSQASTQPEINISFADLQNESPSQDTMLESINRKITRSKLWAEVNMNQVLGQTKIVAPVVIVITVVVCVVLIILFLSQY